MKTKLKKALCITMLILTLFNVIGTPSYVFAEDDTDPTVKELGDKVDSGKIEEENKSFGDAAADLAGGILDGIVGIFTILRKSKSSIIWSCGTIYYFFGS